MWYHNEKNVKFECTGCSGCCKRPGMVLMTDRELGAIAERAPFNVYAHPDIRLHEDGVLWVIDVEDGRPCIFLDEDGRCEVHEVKPWQCRAYPFWPEVLASPRAWEQEKAHCEGIGEGATWSRDIIEALLAEDPLE